MDESNFREILRLSLNLPPVKPLLYTLKPQHPKELTRNQKLRLTAIAKTKKKIEDMQLILQQLIIQKRALFINNQLTDDDKILANELKLTIKKHNRKLWEQKTRLNNYINGSTVGLQDAVLKWDDYKSDLFKFFEGIMYDLYDKEKVFAELKYNKHGVKFPDHKFTVFNRIEKIIKKIRSPLFLSDMDGKWLINIFGKIAENLEHQRHSNDYLPREKVWETESPDYRHETMRGEHRVKWDQVDLATVHSIRSMDRLMTNWGCQLRDDERDKLIKLAQDCKFKLVALFSQDVSKNDHV